MQIGERGAAGADFHFGDNYPWENTSMPVVNPNPLIASATLWNTIYRTQQEGGTSEAYNIIAKNIATLEAAAQADTPEAKVWGSQLALLETYAKDHNLTLPGIVPEEATGTIAYLEGYGFSLGEAADLIEQE